MVQRRWRKEGNGCLFINVSSTVVCDVRAAADAAPQKKAYSKAYRLHHSGGCQLARLGYGLSTVKRLN
jgi:hypothetical protein